jgi:hypothetical protein
MLKRRVERGAPGRPRKETPQLSEQTNSMPENVVCP